ncbi:MAG: hypothetical protein ACOC28_06700 [Alkalispirochaetaceae bacterium]
MAAILGTTLLPPSPTGADHHLLSVTRAIVLRAIVLRAIVLRAIVLRAVVLRAVVLRPSLGEKADPTSAASLQASALLQTTSLLEAASFLQAASSLPATSRSFFAGIVAIPRNNRKRVPARIDTNIIGYARLTCFGRFAGLMPREARPR